MFFYACKPLSLNLAADDSVYDGEAEKPRWIDINTLKAGDFNNDGAAIMQFLRTCDEQG
jgi:hypothetical protein